MPTFVEDVDNKEDEPEDLPDEPLEEGDQNWVTGLLPQPEYICTSSMISQWLADTHK